MASTQSMPDAPPAARFGSLTRADRLALLLSLLAVLLAYLVTDRVFERLPHIEDEVAYIWQARATAMGRLTLASPPQPKSFLVPFVVDYHGQRFGKYPPGWSALLGIGVLFGVRWLVNPLLAGLGVWFTYRLGKRLSSETVGLLAALLTVSSPFFLMNSGSLLSHPFGLVLSLGFVLAWLDAWETPAVNPWPPTLAAALCLGMLALTRPLTAIGIGLPFAFHGLYLLIKRDWQTRRRLVVFCLIVLALASLQFAWQFAATGNPWLNPYTLWWKYDKIGFGPGVGRLSTGHTLSQAKVNTIFSLKVGAHDLFGWGFYSWIFMPFGLLAILRYRLWRAVLPVLVFPSLVLVYLAYWIGSWLFGPRYYYEGLYSLTLLSAMGIAFLAGWPVQPGQAWQRYAGWLRLRPLLVTAMLLLLLNANLVFYTPLRVGGMYGLYNASRSRLAPFLRPEAQEMAPALVIVHPDHWNEYAVLTDLQDLRLDTPFIFVISRGTSADRKVAAAFPGRQVIHYYPSDPYTFYLGVPRDD
ncbi:MAG: hypothetical protein A2W33_01690 [Chloroflexi bacterium RBG_16_52_11]|nr:MAG: hypothetical protein A2W33_01690 [Chloroflexi bacterium RBG_16_52_11]